MPGQTEWATRLRAEIANVRESEAQRTHRFEQRAIKLWNDCYGALQAVHDDANAALRSSNLILRLSRSHQAKLSSWVQMELCELDGAGAPTHVVSAVVISTSHGNQAAYEPLSPDLPPLNLDGIGTSPVQEVVMAFVVAGLRKFLAKP